MEFGDAEPWNVARTVTNAVLRRAAGADGHDRIRLMVEDVEVSETETRTPGGGGSAAGRHVIFDGDGEPLGADEAHGAGPQSPGQHRFRSDVLQIVAFGRYARTVTAAELTGLEGVYEQGTNLHHALSLADATGTIPMPNRWCSS